MKETDSDFQKAIEFSMLWCKAWEAEEITDEVLAERVSELLESLNGARGFLVIALASDFPLLDRLPDPLLIQMRAAGEMMVDLLVKNLAMSTAMAVHHQRKADEKQEASSRRITLRCQEILRLLEPNIVKKRLEVLLTAIEGRGKDVLFLDKWNYDQEQKLEIASKANDVAEE